MDKQIEIINDDAKNACILFGDDYFDIITCNPPYFSTSNVLFENDNLVKATARHEKFLNINDVFVISKRLLKTNGRLAIVHRTDRFIEIVDMAKKYGFSIKKVRFIYPKVGKIVILYLLNVLRMVKMG